MGILDSVERGLERVVNSAFARTFRSGVQPVEIASSLKRELDIGAVVVDRDRVLAPNRFVVRLSPSDASRLTGSGDGTLERELLSIVNTHVERQGYRLLGDADVELLSDDNLRTGVLEVDASRVEGSVAWVPVITVNGARHQLRVGTTTVGRGGDADIRISDGAASRQHLQLVWDGRGGIVRDLGSTNGSKIAGQRFREANLTTGTVITVGKTELRFELVPARSQQSGAPRAARGESSRQTANPAAASTAASASAQRSIPGAAPAQSAPAPRQTPGSAPAPAVPSPAQAPTQAPAAPKHPPTRVTKPAPAPTSAPPSRPPQAAPGIEDDFWRGL